MPSISAIKRPRNITFIVVGLLLGALLLRGLYLVFWAATVQPAVTVPYGTAMNELAAKYQPIGIVGAGVGPDAHALLVVASSDLKSREQANHVAAGGEVAQPVDWPNYSWPTDHTSVFNPNAPAIVRAPSIEFIRSLRSSGHLELQDAFAARPGGKRTFMDSQSLLEVLLPDLGASRNQARMNRARMFLARQEGDDAEFVRAFEHTLAAGRIHLHQAVLIERLVGIAEIALATGEVRESIIEKPVDAATLRGLLEAMDRQLNALPPMELTFEGERIFFHDIVQRMYSDEGNGDGYLIGNVETMSSGSGEMGNAGLFKRLAARFLLATRKETLAEADKMYDGLIAASKIPFVRDRKGLESMEARVEALPHRFLFLRTLMPAFGRALSAENQIRCDIAGTRVMLTIELYRAEKGEYPQTLDDLVPAYLEQVTPEPFRKSGFAYRRLAAGEDPAGRGYLLYSVGHDGADNGGKRAELNVTAVTGRSGLGFDYIINEPREPPKPE